MGSAMDRARTTTRSRSLSSGARRRPGFTLLETMLALVIIGVGVLAFVDAQNAFIKQTSWSSHAQAGAYLANEVRELLVRKSRHDPVTGLFYDTSGGAGGPILIGWGAEDGEATVDDYDDFDDFDGLRFGEGGTHAGPINAFGEVIPQIDATGAVVLGGTGTPIPLRGWTQEVYIEKVDPLNFTTVLADGYPTPAAGVTPPRDVDEFPLRVTVIAKYRGPYDSTAEEMARVTWIVP